MQLIDTAVPKYPRRSFKDHLANHPRSLVEYARTRSTIARAELTKTNADRQPDSELFCLVRSPLSFLNSSYIENASSENESTAKKGNPCKDAGQAGVTLLIL